MAKWIPYVSAVAIVGKILRVKPTSHAWCINVFDGKGYKLPGVLKGNVENLTAKGAKMVFERMSQDSAVLWKAITPELPAANRDKIFVIVDHDVLKAFEVET